MSRISLLVMALALCTGMSGENCTSDSLRAEKFRPAQMIVPATLIAIGAFGVSNGWFCSVKQDVREGFYDIRGDCRLKVDDYLQYLPVAAGLGLGFTGIRTRHSFRERVAITATSYAAMGLMVNVTKWSVREKRPGSDARNSFPSGHTATAFMGAEIVRTEYGNACGIGAYVLATSIAVLRLYNDRHWLNDVLAGAGIGILSARIAYWLLPYERKLFRWEAHGKPSLSALPSYNPAAKTFNLSVTAVF